MFTWVQLLESELVWFAYEIREQDLDVLHGRPFLESSEILTDIFPSDQIRAAFRDTLW